MTTATLPRTETTGASYFDVAAARDALAAGRPVVFPPLEIVRAVIGGRPVSFACNMTGPDPVQDAHRAGRFYEADELATLAQALPRGARVLDVGANVGNHALHLALIAGAARVVVVEPNPLAQAPLVANVVLNGLAQVVELGALGVGLGARSEAGFGMRRHDANLGATRMRPGEGTLEVHAGDSLFAGERFDLVKIDVEGMEMAVLAGLEATIARDRPLVLVEVDHENDAAFTDWVAAHDYQEVAAWAPWHRNRNILLQPRERA